MKKATSTHLKNTCFIFKFKAQPGFQVIAAQCVHSKCHVVDMFVESTSRCDDEVTYYVPGLTLNKKMTVKTKAIYYSGKHYTPKPELAAAIKAA